MLGYLCTDRRAHSHPGRVGRVPSKGPNMLHRCALFALLVSLAGCGADLLPTVGNTLNEARKVYISVDQAAARVASAQVLVCAPEVVLAPAVPWCAEAAAALGEVDKLLGDAHDAFNVAQRLYDAANGDGDAGVP